MILLSVNVLKAVALMKVVLVPCALLGLFAMIIPAEGALLGL